MKICFVGAGSIGKRHIRNVATILKEMGEVAEIDLLRSSNRKLDDDIEKLISRQVLEIADLQEKYDAIFITNPTYLHYQTIKDLMPYTSNFFVEKPVFDVLDLDISDLDCDNRTYYVACPLRYTKVLQRAKEILQNESVVSVRAISSSYLPNWREGIDYRNTYSAHKDQGGGVMIDLIHEWDYLIHMFGFPTDVKQLYGTYSNLEIDSEDVAAYIGQYDDFLVELHLDYCGHITRRNCEVITEQKNYVFDIADSCIWENGEVIERYEEDGNDKYIDEIKEFFSIMRGDVENTNDIEHALSIMRIACDK